MVGIVRKESEMVAALDGLQKLRARARSTGVSGNREYNPGWHTALDLKNLLTVSEAITRSALERKESRGGHFRDDCPDKDADCAKFNVVTFRGPDGQMRIRREPIKEMPAELKAVIEEMK
jgi:succinate dehydrogenase / fumarate reductase flavoprotein subunit